MQAGERVPVGLLAQLLRLAAGGGGLHLGALEAELELGELAHRLALELGASQERVVGLLGAAGVAQGGRDGAEDHRARLRDTVAEPVDRSLPGVARLFEAAERDQRVDLDEHAHAEQVRVRVAGGAEVGDGELGVGERLLGAAAAHAHLGAGAVQDAECEAIVGCKRVGELDPARDLALGGFEVPCSMRRCARSLRESASSHTSPAAIASASITSSRSGQSSTPRLPNAMQPMRRANTRRDGSPVRSASSMASSAWATADRVGAREEVEVGPKRCQLGPCAGVLAGGSARLGGEGEGATEVPAVQRDHALQRERARLQRGVALVERLLVGVDGDGERARRILPVDGACGVDREGGHPVELSRPFARRLESVALGSIHGAS